MAKFITKRRLGKRGFTLIEVIVASAITCIIIIAALSFFLPMTENMRTTQYMADARMLSEMVFDSLRAKLQYAESIEISSTVDSGADWTDGRTYAIYSEADPDASLYLDLLMCNGQPLVAKGFYGRMRFDITYEAVATAASPTTPAVNALNVTVETHLANRTKVISSVKKSFASLNNCPVTDSAAGLGTGLLIKSKAPPPVTPP